MRTFLASEVFMYPLCEKREDNKFPFEKANTDRQTHRHPEVEERDERFGWRSKALTHGSSESPSLLGLPGWGSERQKGKWQGSGSLLP